MSGRCAASALLAALLALLVAIGCGGTDDADTGRLPERLGAPTCERWRRGAGAGDGWPASAPISGCLAREPGGRRPGHRRRRDARRRRPSSTPKRGRSTAATANVELGYLIGAAQRGAEETNGIHAELMRRLVAAATYSPGREVLVEGLRARLPGGLRRRPGRTAEASLPARGRPFGVHPSASRPLAPGCRRRIRLPVRRRSCRPEHLGQQVAVLAARWSWRPASCSDRGRPAVSEPAPAAIFGTVTRARKP